MRVGLFTCLAGVSAVVCAQAVLSSGPNLAASGRESATYRFINLREDKVDDFHRSLAAEEAKQAPDRGELQHVQIPLVFHVVTPEKLNTTMREKMVIAKADYIGVCKWRLTSWNRDGFWGSSATRSTKRNDRPEWVVMNNRSMEHRMMNALHQGGHETFKLIIGDFGASWSEQGEPLDGPNDTMSRLPLDTCVLGGQWLPSNTGPSYGGCGAENDFITDTPASLAREQCGIAAENIDFCPDLPGLDPVRNYMGLSAESDRKEFTAGQFRRMHTLWREYRSSKA
ncbi:hypothetical protein HIM_09430 [Hirsutella minnesotensis 3608]|uniref:Peptidase M43 pregnancy-associated plasma-A domain-containing protein n=1 Tax=Hirsutella minnesotensis 3608 TaxID=1043627 RepID=A0A0F7ZLJ3_9HYPO|nr:hypothetical protein HIM_09430 [Hirsutella minnesotensis 3608]